MPAKLKSSIAMAYAFQPCSASGRTPASPVDQALEPAEHPVEPDGLPLVDPGHVEPERLHQKEQHDQIERQLNGPVSGHENTSGFRSATTR